MKRLVNFFSAWMAVSLACAATASAAEPPHSRELLREGDLQLDVLVDGSAGPTVVLLPSSKRDSLDFDALASRLAASGLRVLRPQPRGMGRSTGPMADLSLSVLASDVALAVKRLGNGRAVIAGHAYGHFVARVTDLEHPEIVRGVVVIAGAARVFPPSVPPTLAIASDPSRPRDERLKALQAGFFAPGNDPTPWLEGWYPNLAEAYSKAGAKPPKDAWWPVSHSPLLDLQGASDPWRPEASRDELKAALGEKVTVRVIPGASHAMVPERPAQVAEAIVAWMRTLPPD